MKLEKILFFSFILVILLCVTLTIIFSSGTASFGITIVGIILSILLGTALGL